jgi:hypothetical protein
MIGSSFIHTLDSSVLISIAEDVEVIEKVNHVEMDGLITLDFESICSSVGMQWSASEPVAFDEGAGFAIFKIEHEPDLSATVLRSHCQFLRVEGTANLGR